MNGHKLFTNSCGLSFSRDIIILMRKWVKSAKRNESKPIDVKDLLENYYVCYERT